MPPKHTRDTGHYHALLALLPWENKSTQITLLIVKSEDTILKNPNETKEQQYPSCRTGLKTDFIQLLLVQRQDSKMKVFVQMWEAEKSLSA